MKTPIVHPRFAFASLLLLAAPAAAEDSGPAIYKKRCASCHGAEGKGNPNQAKTLKIEATKLDLTRAEAASMKRDELKAAIVDGKNKMPAYKAKLKSEEIDAVLNHVEHLRGGGTHGGAK